MGELNAEASAPTAADGREARLRALEAVLFVASEPLPAMTLAQLLDVEREDVEGLLRTLAERRADSGIVVRNVAGGWRLSSHPEVAPVLEQFILSSHHLRLTKAAVETLAIVAYKQPVTRHQVSAIRGVDSDGVLRALVDRGLVTEVGREEGPGRPVLFGTTPEFLERLGLASIGDLPPLAPLLGDEEKDEPEDSEGTTDDALPAD
ncbi:MAG: SMC-Scp complex subunit ScpB [Actinomycetota bacterium]